MRKNVGVRGREGEREGEREVEVGLKILTKHTTIAINTLNGRFENGRDMVAGSNAPFYILRPETVESFFILNKLTGDPVYREWGWEVYQAIEKYCRTEVAYGGIDDVRRTGSKPTDRMESFFLAETMKYLYLLQDPDTEVDILNKHVFNTEAHPLRKLELVKKRAS